MASIIDAGLDTVGRKQDVPLGMLSNIASAFPGLPVSTVRSVINMSVGTSPIQKLARKGNKVTKGYFGPTRLGAAVTEEDDLQKRLNDLLAGISGR